MPTALFSPMSGKILIQLYGVEYGDCSIATEGKREHVGEILCEEGIPIVYAPKPTQSNAVICHADELRMLLKTKNNVVFHRGIQADGVFFEDPGQCFWMSTADCLVIVLFHEPSGTWIATHAGRASLIDLPLIQEGKEPRKHFSVVDSACELFRNKFGSDATESVSAFMTCSIGPESFDHPLDHPDYGENNRKMLNYLLKHYGMTVVPNYKKGMISLSELARRQLIENEVPAHRIGFDLIDTATDSSAESKYAWWSHRRSFNEKDEETIHYRNGVFICRTF